MRQTDLFGHALSAEDGPAKETRWLASVLEWLTNEAASGVRFGAFFRSSVPSGFLEKTCLAFCPSAVVPPAQPFSLLKQRTQNGEGESLADALDAMPEQDYLSLIEEEISSVCWPTWQTWGMGSPTAFSTLSGSEFRSGAVACSLSDVLETGDVPPKYFLSPTACRGILRRAAARNRALPEPLMLALENAAGRESIQAS